ncbi:hypothetical protein [Haloechinothrix salitolerans]|uniref:Uncharacterized protein n=1 Tax=Haloechinothrix salitolerans TaxID=926830 RepID=A0ABW2C885_9PSEU
MSAFDVLERYGTAALLRFLGAVAMFVALHLLRLPFVLVCRLLEVGMRRVDVYLTTAATTRAYTWPTSDPDTDQPGHDKTRFQRPATAGAHR